MKLVLWLLVLVLVLELGLSVFVTMVEVNPGVEVMVENETDDELVVLVAGAGTVLEETLLLAVVGSVVESVLLPRILSVICKRFCIVFFHCKTSHLKFGSRLCLLIPTSSNWSFLSSKSFQLKLLQYLL